MRKTKSYISDAETFATNLRPAAGITYNFHVCPSYGCPLPLRRICCPLMYMPFNMLVGFWVGPGFGVEGDGVLAFDRAKTHDRYL